VANRHDVHGQFIRISSSSHQRFIQVSEGVAMKFATSFVFLTRCAFAEPLGPAVSPELDRAFLTFPARNSVRFWKAGQHKADVAKIDRAPVIYVLHRPEFE
jgi:hypothetical protein